MGSAITADTYVPMIPRKPGEFRKWGWNRSAARGRIKTTYFKYLSMGICKGMAKGAIHLYLKGGLGNMPVAIAADNDWIFKADGISHSLGLDLGCLFRQKIHK
ncbi:MAG: hypothetical protein GY860_24655 [Desulfobacteraceae bacterium]|nr:hypothetical protein [Desulfobacteraceae bacterium]